MIPDMVAHTVRVCALGRLGRVPSQLDDTHAGAGATKTFDTRMFCSPPERIFVRGRRTSSRPTWWIALDNGFPMEWNNRKRE
ncbi:hypothetical protein GGX14DRAFT_553702 [Mycena pura]|uniref:Uncharacterized protein n=1 Tax=Mycena pura TaxID=153505 RepID=A0AAD6YV43_9AGAR|nr:hypothetical protein GGX14DRAFT_553702 [Mycena pura]